jgi:hypothetical protein
MPLMLLERIVPGQQSLEELDRPNLNARIDPQNFFVAE